jgi:hypothetical protein
MTMKVFAAARRLSSVFNDFSDGFNSFITGMASKRSFAGKRYNHNSSMTRSPQP